MQSFRSFWIFAALAAAPLFGQSWSVGGAGGFSVYHDATINASGQSAQAGFGSRFAVGGLLGEDIGNYFGGELRYMYIDGDTVLRSGGQEVNMDAASHALHYDFVFYGMPRHSRFRPYAAVGAGIKRYTGTGREYSFQPLSNFAFLTHTDEVKALVSFGAGVKYRLNERWVVRADFRDYATPFPEKLIAPNGNAKVSGWLHDFVPMIGIDWTFGRE